MANTQIGLNDVPEALQKISAVVAIESPGTGQYNFVLDAPFDGEIDSIAYALGGGTSATFEVECDGVDVTFTGSVTSFVASSSTVTSISATGTNTFEAGDVLRINVTGTSGSPTNLNIQVNIKRTAE